MYNKLTMALCILLVVAMLLAACSQRKGLPSGSLSDAGGQPPSQAQPPGPFETLQPQSQAPLPAQPNPEQEGDAINSALALIPGSERLAASGESLFMLKEYGFEMKWMEANQIAHLERGTPTAQDETYFLLLPKYTGSQVEVYRLEWKDAEWVPVKTLYSNKSTPDNFGLVLTSNEPEAGPNLRVAVRYGGQEYSWNFGYDGRGDRPAILALPQDEKWWETR